jgi:hypothetical protein
LTFKYFYVIVFQSFTLQETGDKIRTITEEISEDSDLLQNLNMNRREVRITLFMISIFYMIVWCLILDHIVYFFYIYLIPRDFVHFCCIVFIWSLFINWCQFHHLHSLIHIHTNSSHRVIIFSLSHTYIYTYTLSHTSTNSNTHTH